MNWFLSFEKWLSKTLGYDFVVHFEDGIVFGSGIMLGLIIMAILCGHVVFRLKKIKDFKSKQIKLIRFKHEGINRYEYAVAPENVGESIETLLLVIFRPFFQDRDYDLRDERRTKIFLIIMGIIAIVLFTLAILCISTVVSDG